jgi:uncharacterized protein YlzI (FlbEa/FlbD family)
MKLIRLYTEDGTLWVINTNNISAISKAENSNECVIYLNSGEKLKTKWSVEEIIESIK